MENGLISLEPEVVIPEIVDKEEIEELERTLVSHKYTKYGRFIAAALGSIPWIGGIFSASAALHAESEQRNINKTIEDWLREHDERLLLLRKDISAIINRLEDFGEQVDERVADEGYLSLVRQGFRTWDQSETAEKRALVRRILTNAGATRLSSDDVVRLFLDWIDQYHEIHFRVIRSIYQNPGATRARIWELIHGEFVREDSAEADLFKLMIRDLSTGGVIRQSRATNEEGQFLAKTTRGRSKRRSQTLESAFEDTKPYELTQLGQQFVHYAMNEAVPRIAGDTEQPQV